MLTPQEYADAISAHARLGIHDSLYPGLNFANLASFLQKPFQNVRTVYASTSTDNNDASFTFVRQYMYPNEGRPEVKSFKHPDEFREASLPSAQSDKAHTILFLRGAPSALWLAVIGGTYCIDPEFFQRHLDFWSSYGRINYYPLPSLPSTSDRMIELVYVSVGQRENPGKKPTTIEMEQTRLASLKSLNKYTHSLNTSMGNAGALGNSVVRGFDLLDETHFAIEQRISIYLSSSGQSRTSESTFKKSPWTKLIEAMDRFSLA